VPHDAFSSPHSQTLACMNSSISPFHDDARKLRSTIRVVYHASARVALFRTFFARVQSMGLKIETRKSLHSFFCRSSIRPGAGTGGFGALFFREKRYRFSMGVLFQSVFRFLDEPGTPSGPARVSLSAPFPFHAVRMFCCSAASHRDAEEAVCPFVVNMQ
jgi:hypothetical protein